MSVQRLGSIAVAALLAGCAQGPAPMAPPMGAPMGPPPGAAAPAPGLQQPGYQPPPVEGQRLVVTPVFYVPSDVSFDPQTEMRGASLISGHLELARRRYARLLVVDTFAYAIEQPLTYRSAMTTMQLEGSSPDTAHTMTRELLAFRGETRTSSRHVFVALVVRAPDRPCGRGVGVRCMGGGRTFNGAPGTGGGFVQLEAATLFAGRNFHSTLVHEIGHAFGLSHADCHGESMHDGRSIMSYNRRHWSNGFAESGEGWFTVEDIVTLARNTLAFPLLAGHPNVRSMTRKGLIRVDGECDLGPMDASIGPLPFAR